MNQYQDVDGACAGGAISSAVVFVAILGKLYLGKLYLGKLVGLLADLGAALLRVLPDVLTGVVTGDVVVACGFVLLGVFSISIEVGQRRAALVPAHLRALPPVAPRTLRWVHGQLPGSEGVEWLAEVNSCLAETPDKDQRRRYVRSYRRGVPRLVWNSWALHFSGSQSRTLS